MSNRIECTHENCNRTFMDDDAMADHAEIVHSFGDMQRSARNSVREKYGRDSYIRDMGEEWLVIEMYNDGDTKLLKVSYSSSEGEVTLGEDEMQVVHRNAYLPASKQESAAIAMASIGVSLTDSAGLASKTSASVGGIHPTNAPHSFAQEESAGGDPTVCTDCGRRKGHSIHS